jgi:hypothetical protein
MEIVEQKREHTKLIGDRTTAMVLAHLLTKYESVCIPFGDNLRYDLLVDTGEKVLRIQCKTGRLRQGSVRFATVSYSYHHPSYVNGIREGKQINARHPYKGQADLFGVYCPETREVYLFPVDEAGASTISLRVEPPKNNQEKGVRWAADYRITPG